MFEIPVGARHLLIQESDATSHHLGKCATSRTNFRSEYFFSCLFLSWEPHNMFMHLFTRYPPTPHTSFKYVKLGNLFGNSISLCCVPWSPNKNIPARVKAADRGAELLYWLQCIIFQCAFHPVVTELHPRAKSTFVLFQTLPHS